MDVLVMSLGHGVTIDRSPFSELAFSEAMQKCGYISDRGTTFPQL